jgi:hypothetical protein
VRSALRGAINLETVDASHSGPLALMMV